MKIFHHNDNDGKAAAAMIYIALDIQGIKFKKDDFISVNYNDSIPTADQIQINDWVFIVDYSFTEATVHNLYEICEKANKVWWYDHHKSSLEVYDKIVADDICEEVIVDMNRSGARITYDRYIKDWDKDIFLMNTEGIDIYNIARVIELVDDYDRWIHALPNSMTFNFGSQMVPNDPMDEIWYSDPSIIIAKGKLIKEYNDAKNSKIVKNNGYEITINGHKCIVLNTPERSSQSFAEYYNEYKLAIVWSFNGKNFTHSIYSSLEDIDCSKIVQYFNPTGGGHKGAAGFVSDKMIFTEGLEFVI